jgi:hypothetical protein
MRLVSTQNTTKQALSVDTNLEIIGITRLLSKRSEVQILFPQPIKALKPQRFEGFFFSGLVPVSTLSINTFLHP